MRLNTTNTLTIFGSLILFLFIVTPLSCNRETTTKVIVAESSLSVPASLSFIARSKGFWKKQGLDVSVVSFAAGRLALDALLNGQAQFATAAETPLATGAFRHNTYTIISEMMNTTTETKVIARRDAGISKPSDLAGKKIGVFVGTQAEYFMDIFLSHHQVKRSSITVVNLQPPDMITAIVKGEIDAMVVWQPHAYNAIERLGQRAIVFPNEGIYTGIFCMVTLRSFAEKNPEIVEKILAGLIEAERFVETNPDEAIKIVADQVGIEPASLKNFYGEYKFKVKSSDILLDVLQKEGKWAIDSKIVDPGSQLPDYRSYIHTDALKRIAPERVTISEK